MSAGEDRRYSSLNSRLSTLDSAPLVLFGDSGAGGLRVTACCRAAAAHGVAPGMRLAEAEGLWTPEALRGPRGPRFVPHDTRADRESLIKLAQWCERFSPLIGIAGSDSLLLDITGCAHLFGGEAGLARRVLHDFRRCGLRVRVALADTVGAAWGVARYATAAALAGWHAQSEAMGVANTQQTYSKEKTIAKCTRPSRPLTRPVQIANLELKETTGDGEPRGLSSRPSALGHGDKP